MVFSQTLARAEWPTTRISRSDLTDEIRELKEAPGKDVALGGGPRLAQAMLDQSLFEEVYLTVFPTMVGRGKPLFRVEPVPDNPGGVVSIGSPGRRDFTLLEARP